MNIVSPKNRLIWFIIHSTLSFSRGILHNARYKKGCQKHNQTQKSVNPTNRDTQSNTHTSHTYVVHYGIIADKLSIISCLVGCGGYSITSGKQLIQKFTACVLVTTLNWKSEFDCANACISVSSPLAIHRQTPFFSASHPLNIMLYGSRSVYGCVPSGRSLQRTAFIAIGQ